MSNSYPIHRMNDIFFVRPDQSKIAAQQMISPSEIILHITYNVCITRFINQYVAICSQKLMQSILSRSNLEIDRQVGPCKILILSQKLCIRKQHVRS